MKGFQLICVGVFTLVSPIFAQLKFSGGVSSGGSSSSSVSGSQDANKKLFGITSGNEAIDGGIVGLGLGALGATVLGGALNGGGGGYSGCGRRKRDAQSGEERFFLPSGGSCTCGRKKRQAPGEDGVNTKFFNLGGLLGGNNNNHCGSCCYNNNGGGFNGGFNNGGGFNNNGGGFNGGFNNNGGGLNNNYNNNRQCQCDNSKYFRDQYNNIHGACQRSDNTGRRWCYTTGWNNQGCGDLQSSKRYQNNPWSYNACPHNG